METQLQAQLFNWFWKKDRKFTVEEVRDLVQRINTFNCGAIDEYLTRHTNMVFEEWLKEKQQ